MFETLNLTIIGALLIICLSAVWLIHSRSRLGENSSKTLKNRIKQLEEEVDLYQKLQSKWKTRYFNLEKQVEEGFDLSGDTSSNEGIIGMVSQFLPMIAERFPQAKGILDNKEILGYVIDALQKHPDLLKNIVPALLGNKKNKDSKQIPDKNKEQVEQQIKESYHIVQ